MSEAFAYDVVDYPSHVYPQLHPSRLSAIARLHGVHAASPKTCRLLEVGCGDGLQLLTMAMAYPDSRFIGVDLSHAAIARGEALRVRLGLDNLRLVAADLLEWEPGPQPYDFILAHGFYSWVPDVVRERLLHLCGTGLADAGVACISYNALPGCHLRRMLWEILKFHSGAETSPKARVASAIDCLDLLAMGMPGDRRYTSTMAAEIAELKDRLDPNVLFHDDLAAINEPFTLDQFMRHASGHGLGFLAEASYHEMSLRNANEEVRPLLEEIGRDDIVTKEQYLDFFSGRRFRQTLLCRQTASPRPVADPAVVAGLDVVTEMTPDPPGTDPDNGEGLRFSHPSSGGLRTKDPVFQALLALCAQRHAHPQPMRAALEEARAIAGSGDSPEADCTRVCDSVLRAFEVGVLDLHCDAPGFALDIPERPVASPLARVLSEAGQTLIPSLRPRMVDLKDPALRALLQILDGSRDRAALLRDLAERMATSTGSDADDAGGATGGWAEQLSQDVEDALRKLSQSALLAAGR
jgi:hypothetical protein